MKTSEKIKKGQECCTAVSVGPHWKVCSKQCPYWEIDYCKVRLNQDTLSYIAALESYVSQVSKALCGKENATICEILEAVSQAKASLAQVERERDAAVKDISYFFPSPEVCKHYEYCQSVQDDPWHGCLGPVDCADYQYRGVCALNTKEE